MPGSIIAPGSMKARLCVEGRERLYAYCLDRNIGHARTGKLIVAVEPAQLDKLRAIQRQCRTMRVAISNF